MPKDGLTLKFERIQAGIKQYQLAQQIGCSRQLITKWEGMATLPAKTMRQYRMALLTLADIAEVVA